MRVALFGGSFNPPHVAHQLVALYVLETAPVDELWLVPAYEHAFGKPLAAFDDRLAMCELAAAALGPRARVSDVERAIGGRSLTLRTVRRLAELHPEHSFSLVIGSDLVREVASWYGGDELARTIPFIVVGRSGAGETVSGVAMPEVSSTAVRAALAAGKPADGLVPRAVLDYIYRKGLYKEPA
ncbi:MAG TPA: nicotinate (nicotinamide) nucleotide adenylyltransferase [Polyangia bacterium]